MSCKNIKTKGSKEGKSDGSKQQEVGPALFPRLHVADTKKAGPRGPPRNKMAFSEQPTIPAHKFKPSPIALPSSGRNWKYPSMGTPAYLPQVQAGSYDSMYSFVPMNYMNSGIVPTMGCVPMMNSGLHSVESRSSLNTSSSKSTVVDVSSEPSVGGAVAQKPKYFNHSKEHSPSKMVSRDDEFAVPAHSSATPSSNQTRPSSLFQTQKDSREEQPLVGFKKFVLEKRTSACMNPVRRIVTEKSIEVTSGKRKDDTSWHTSSGECTTISAIDNDVNSQEIRHKELERIPVGHADHAKPNSVKIRQEDNLVRTQGREARKTVFGLAKSTETHATAAPVSKMLSSEQDIISNISSENQSDEVSELYQQKRGSSARTDSSMLENVPTDCVQLRDVLNIFGQQEFWKTQKVIIRQQRIFSKQVFELHRIIEVQHLLAKELCFSINADEDKVEEEDDNVSVPSSPLAVVPELLEDSDISGASQVPEISKVPERCLDTNICEASNEAPTPVPPPFPGPIYPLSVPSQHNFTPESLRQAPPYAANPWAPRMASPYVYVPYPPTCPPGYGAYPMMGASVPVYGHPGAMPVFRFPAWPMPGMSYPWNSQDPGEAAAWYGQQAVSGTPPAPSKDLSSPPSDMEHFAYSSGSGQSVERTTQMGNARSAAEMSDAVANRSNKGDYVEGWDRAEGEVRREVRVREDRDLTQKAGHIADLRGDKADYDDGSARQDTEAEQDDSDCEVKNQGNERNPETIRGVELDLTGRKQKGSSNGKSLKHMRSESLDPDACRWFPILSPAKRSMHQHGVIKAVPRAVSATPESAANILLSIQTEKWR